MVGDRKSSFDFYSKNKKTIPNITWQLDQECMGKHPTEFIISGFKKCCISNCLDGIENNAIYEEDEPTISGTSGVINKVISIYFKVYKI